MKLDLYIISNYKITSYYFKGNELGLCNELIKNNNKFIMHTIENGQIEIQARLEDENIFLSSININCFSDIYNF